METVAANADIKLTTAVAQGAADTSAAAPTSTVAAPQDNGTPAEAPSSTAPTEPQHPACLRCKQLKVRCAPTDLGGCERCKRAGRPCMPAPPSRQGKRTRPTEVVAVYDDAMLPTPVAQLTHLTAHSAMISESAFQLIGAMAKEWGPQNCCADFLQGFFAGPPPSAESILWLLRHWATVATVRNSHVLLQRTLDLAGACNIAVGSLVYRLESALRPAAHSPPAVVHCVEAMPGFGMARSANPMSNGSIDVICNRAFREHVLGPEQLLATWHANDVEMLSRFVHPEDVHILPHETGRFFSQMAGVLQTLMNSAPATHPTQRVVRILIDGAYVTCHAIIKACSADGTLYFGFFLSPVAAPPALAAASLLELTHAFVHKAADGASSAAPAAPAFENVSSAVSAAGSSTECEVEPPPGMPCATPAEPAAAVPMAPPLSSGIEHGAASGQLFAASLYDVFAW